MRTSPYVSVLISYPCDLHTLENESKTGLLAPNAKHVIRGDLTRFRNGVGGGLLGLVGTDTVAGLLGKESGCMRELKADWVMGLQVLTEPRLVFRTSRGTRGRLTVSWDGRNLHFRGLLVGSIY